MKASSKHENSELINVLELRNYLLKPNLTDSFSRYFHSHFVAPMNELNGYTLGEFKIRGVNDRFVWFRGFADMQARVKFLNDFYFRSAAWKKYGKGANEMMLNSSNVFLLKPLNKNYSIKTEKEIVVVDFYICNSTRDEVINLFEKEYIPFIRTLGVEDISLWTSEMAENDFPELPVFQDKNLLVTITNYQDKSEYNARQKEIRSMPTLLKKSMQELITAHNDWLLINQNGKH
jgi:hypothetical protein